ncbi:Beta-lactamase enzyme family protein [Georgenia satyanarayanai]|uniref:Beta-lactamase enzyme family protein n=1 Tax=Georgenia satyanarayanai TaxID=860221 RepID=A0A2Y9AA67_9MICO|nr:serine hydrolase [Georgenia satyanarayanai]PYG01170.1 beta-lactamase family protein [Georgenia satyanarayanai]SSA39409.1 Beta-lactamase enzyme family protein [Georgenia satyanarayanai]
MPRGRRQVGSVALALVLLTGACGGTQQEPEDPPSSSAPPAPPTEEVSISDGVTLPETRAGQAAAWVLEQLAADEGPSAEEAQERFADAFLTQVPAPQVAAVFAQLRAGGPYVVEGYNGTEDAARLPLVAADGRFLLHVVTEPDGRMGTLFFEATRAVPDVTSLRDLDDALAGLDAETSLLVADGASCEPLHERESDVARPIGSIVKLYVLDAVRQAVADGTLTWEDTLTLTDDLRSLPSGVLQEEPAGHQVSVREAAELMISVSDNTATDLLVDAVGREAVLTAVERLGHHDPALLTPIVTTRELFQLGFTDPDLREQWATADTAGREEILAGLPGGEVAFDPALAQDVVWTDDLDWFATAHDLCRAHAALQESGDETVLDILALSPGIEVPEGWEYVGFKGGSAPGEMAGSWYLGSADGEGYAVVVQIAATDVAAVPDAGWMAGVVGQTAEVLAEEE